MRRAERLAARRERELLLLPRHAKLPQLRSHYHDDPEKTASLLPRATASSHIGDIGHGRRPGLRVYLADRKSNTIISGGVNIYPAWRSRTPCSGHPAVADVGVFGIPDDEWGESVKAAIELAPGHEPSDELAEAILAYAREHLAGYKIPRSIDFESELPRSPSGKLYVRRLRDRYWQGHDRQI